MASSLPAPPPPAGGGEDEPSPLLDARDEQVLDALSETLDRLQALLRRRRQERARRRRAVLIATADAALAGATQALLAAQLCRSFWVTSSAEAAASATTRGFDLILLDLEPALEALRWVRRIRTLPAPYGCAPIAAFTVRLDDALCEAAADAGVDAFLAKPLSAARLAEVLSLLTSARDADAP